VRWAHEMKRKSKTKVNVLALLQKSANGFATGCKTKKRLQLRILFLCLILDFAVSTELIYGQLFICPA
jgi:hypothetical protein